MSRAWTIDDAREMYNIRGWSSNLFDISADGNVVMKASEIELDIRKLVDDLVERDIEPPILIRFTDVLRARVDALCGTFHASIEKHEYTGAYRGVFPIKVNQQRQVVEEMVRCGEPYHLGLECGSKPELMIVLAELQDPEALIICNGYKDREYIEMALIARKMGRRCVLVIEQSSELETVIEVAAALKIPADLGVRVRLKAQGQGRWKDSSGERAKFGLSPTELVAAVNRLREVGKLEWLHLLHFHIGSQIPSIRRIRTAVREGARFYVELVKLGAPMGYFDVGGGLGIDYDGSRTDFESSMNYDLTEYADTIVGTIQTVCGETGVACPNLVTETGRALVAHASMLVVPVLEATTRSLDVPKDAGERYESAAAMLEILGNLSARNPQPLYHEAVDVREEVVRRFELGLAGLEEVAAVDSLFWRVANQLYAVLRKHGDLPEDLEALEQCGVDTYYCNFSVFQSMPDSWAIRQLFPIIPLQRLNERPTRRGTLADITCDSDGKVDRFVDVRDVKRALELHTMKKEPYYLGVFLLGAYQEILGDLHNLFGDTNAVHVSASNSKMGYRIEQMVEGDTVKDVLRYVQYDHNELFSRVRKIVEEAHERGDLTVPEGRRLLKTYRNGLEDYTYLAATED